MEYYSVLMIIFSGFILLYGFHIFKSRNPYLPYNYHGKRTKKYYEYLGKIVMVVSLAPFISGVSAIIISSTLLSLGLLVGGFILTLFLCIKYFHE